MSATRKAVIVTGATGGIGTALVRQLAEAGWLPIVGHRPSKEGVASALVNQLRDSGADAVALPLPLDEPGALDGAVAAIAAMEVDVHAMVLAASPPPELASFLKTAPAAHRLQFEAQVVGNHHLLAAVWKRLWRARGGGHVVAVLSEAMGPPPTPHMSSYTVAKAGLLALLESAISELGTAGLRASVIRPGFTETPMLDSFPDLVLQRARDRMPGKRFATPEMVAAELVACLAAPPTEPRVMLHSPLPT